MAREHANGASTEPNDCYASPPHSDFDLKHDVSPTSETSPVQPLEINIEPASSISSLLESGSNSPNSLKGQPIPTGSTEPESPTTSKEPPDVTSGSNASIPVSSNGASPLPGKRSVRFRSRVRITSGFPRRRSKERKSIPPLTPFPQHGDSSTADALSPESARDLDDPFETSSNSSSPSSSISAPLKYRRDSSSTYDGNSIWKPLGQRINFLTAGNEERRRRRDQRMLGMANEQSSLLGHGPARSRYDGELFGTGGRDEEAMDAEYAEQIAKEIELVFGPWPNRLFNRHWWWWQIEPLLCCLCLDEEPDE